MTSLDSSAAQDGDLDQIEALIQAFFQVFDNREGRVPDEAALRACCLPGVVVRAWTPHGFEEMDLSAFWPPRQALLSSGRLQAFHEWPVGGAAQQAWIDGDLASVRVRYAKAGVLDGAAWSGQGVKHFQLVRTGEGWRIAGLAWQDAS